VRGFKIWRATYALLGSVVTDGEQGYAGRPTIQKPFTRARKVVYGPETGANGGAI
jgi:hypothetical protein